MHNTSSNAFTFALTLVATFIVCAFGCQTSTNRSGHVNDSAQSAAQLHLMAARADWNDNPTESNAIWVGRRLAYLGRYDDAVNWYRDALEQWPDSHRLRRHLGHRLISLRQFDDAVDILTEARNLAAKHPNRIEADGAPNAFDTPRSSSHGNIDYHLALAHYCRGEFETAANYWLDCVLQWSMTDDSKVAALHWLHLSLHRAGRSGAAQSVLGFMPDDPDVIENAAYLALVRIYQGQLDPESLASTENSPSGAALEYGLARYWIRQGNAIRGNTMLRALVESPDARASFGAIAAEADLARTSNQLTN